MKRRMVFVQRAWVAICGVDEDKLTARLPAALGSHEKRARRCQPRRQGDDVGLFHWRRWQIRLALCRSVTTSIATSTAAPHVPAETRYLHPAKGARDPLTRKELALKAEIAADTTLPRRPKTDLECRAAGLGTRVPCPFVSCQHHLGIHVMDRGALQVVYPHWEGDVPDDGKTCVLAEAERGEHTAREIGHALGIGISRVMQLEASAIAKVAARFGMQPDALRAALAKSR